MERLEHRQYLVGVRCMTFNQSSYIIDALNGFVMQQTSFPFVCMIVDDASTEGEPEVIRKYLREYFDWQDPSAVWEKEMEYGQVFFAQHKTNRNCIFAVILLNVNHYSQRKNKLAYFEGWLDAKYIALCEGDDYWTDPHKLQKQADYMEAHPECQLSVHSADWETGGSVYPYGCQEPKPKDLSVEELIRCGGLYFATASFFFKSELDQDFPDWRQKARVGDYPLQILSGLRGNVHYLPQKMCVYRYMHDSSWSVRTLHGKDNNTFQRNKIEWMTLLDEDTGHRYQGVIYDHLFQYFNSLFNGGEISYWEYAKAVSKMGKKRYGRLLKDGVRLVLSSITSNRKI